MLAVPLVFYTVLFALGMSLEDARAEGYIKNITEQQSWTTTWEHFDLSQMRWGVLPGLFPTWLAMYLVVAFGSCLDVAAIQLSMVRPRLLVVPATES